MTDTTETTSTPVLSPTERIVFALRQAAFMAVALLVAGLVTERLQPAAGRSIVSSQFLWAIVIWLAVLLLNAVLFERSQMPELEGMPLYAALGAGAFVFVAGLIGVDGGSFARRAAFSFSTSLGTIMFWWGVLSLGFLIVQRLRD